MRRIHVGLMVLWAALASGAGLFADAIPAGWTLSPSGVGGLSAAAANIVPTEGSYFGFIDTTGTSDTSFTGVIGAVSGSVLLSPTFVVGAGQTLRVDLNFLTNDGEEFQDFALVQLLSAGTGLPVATLYTANTGGAGAQAVPASGGPGPVSAGAALSPASAVFDGNFTGLVGGIPYGPTTWLGAPGGATGWVTSSFAPGSGTYQLRFVVSDVSDVGVPSALAMDNLRVGDNLIGSLEPAPAAEAPEPAAGLLVLGGLGLLRAARGKTRRPGPTR
ncbi:MAG: hypothetical protein HY822_24830 [Acidobacteria bacterium]|nr:hypothetical protein [Acidobacteriota bacterium]